MKGGCLRRERDCIAPAPVSRSHTLSSRPPCRDPDGARPGDPPGDPRLRGDDAWPLIFPVAPVVPIALSFPAPPSFPYVPAIPVRLRHSRAGGNLSPATAHPETRNSTPCTRRGAHDPHTRRGSRVPHTRRGAAGWNRAPPRFHVPGPEPGNQCEHASDPSGAPDPRLGGRGNEAGWRRSRHGLPPPVRAGRPPPSWRG